MKVYIAGKITGNIAYRQQFMAAETRLAEMGHSVMNPAWLYAYPEFGYEDYIAVSKAMLERCDAILLLPSWDHSPGAKKERALAEKRGIAVFDCSDGSERPEGGWSLLLSAAMEQGLCGSNPAEVQPEIDAYAEGYKAGLKAKSTSARTRRNGKVARRKRG